jgi:hypothetical protein
MSTGATAHVHTPTARRTPGSCPLFLPKTGALGQPSTDTGISPWKTVYYTISRTAAMVRQVGLRKLRGGAFRSRPTARHTEASATRIQRH